MELARPEDAFFLHTETPRVQQHVGGLLVLDPSSRPGGAISLPELTALVERRIHLVPRLRQRVLWPPLGLSRPVWVDDPGFELARHISAATVGDGDGAGDASGLECLLGRIMARPLERSRPLWQVVLIDGLPRGEQAVLLKVHHAVVDGVGAVAVAAAILFDGRPPQPRDPPTRWAPAPLPSSGRVLRASLAAQVSSPAAALRACARRAARRPDGALRDTARVLAGTARLASAGAARPAWFNRTVGPHRRIAVADVPLDLVRALRGPGGTDQDVVLTIAAEALAEATSHRAGAAARLPDPLRVVVPVSVRPRGGARLPGSWTSSLPVRLPVGEMSILERHAAVRAETAGLARAPEPAAAWFLMTLAGLALPAGLHGLAARFAYRGRWFNTIVSSVPGPRAEVRVAGARVSVTYPLVPLAADVGVTVAAMRWGDRMAFGVTSDPAILGRPAEVRDSIVDALERLRAAAG